MPLPPLPAIECSVCGRRPKISFSTNPRRNWVLAVLRDDGWHIRMLGDGRYASVCPDCCDLQERMDRDQRGVHDMRESGRKPPAMVFQGPLLDHTPG